MATYRVVHDERHTVPGVHRAEERLEVIPVPDDDMGQDGTKRKVRGDQVQSVGRGVVCGLHGWHGQDDLNLEREISHYSPQAART